MEPYSSDDIKRKRRKKHFKKTPEEFPVDLSKLRSDEWYIIVSEKEKIIYIWKGLNCNVRKMFIASKAAQDIRGQKGLDFTIISLKEGEENPEFLRLIGDNDIKRKRRKNSYLLNKLLGANPEVTFAAIVSAEGLPIAYGLPQWIDETRIAAMTATLLSLSERAIIEMGKGDFDQLYIKGSEGYLLVMQAGPDMVLIVSTKKNVRLGFILLDCRRTCEKIAQLGIDIIMMEGDDDEDRLPFPYIFNPPEPPGDLGVVPQLLVKKSIEKEPEDEYYCQYCGMKLTDGERISHNCRKKH